MGFEPTHDGTTTRCVNHFTTAAIVLYYINKNLHKCKEKNEKVSKKLASLITMIYNVNSKTLMRTSTWSNI